MNCNFLFLHSAKSNFLSPPWIEFLVLRQRSVPQADELAIHSECAVVYRYPTLTHEQSHNYVNI